MKVLEEDTRDPLVLETAAVPALISRLRGGGWGKTWIAGSEDRVRKKCDLLGVDLAW